MWQLMVSILILGVIGSALKWIGVALNIIFLYFILPVAGLSIIYVVGRSVYHAFNPEAKQAYLERRAKDAERYRREKDRDEAEARAKKELEEAERRREELERQRHRDADQQVTPYTYKIGKHGNESLAIRYGIANQERKVKEYWYYAKGGEQKRNPSRDRVLYEPANAIRLQKTRRISKDLYEVLLTDFRDRKARAVIEPGADYVKTFYPLDDDWFVKNSDLEEALKGNNSFTLKELATFHIQKAVGL